MPAVAELADITGVELIRTGQWKISTGTWTASRDDLAAAIAARACPAVRRPVIKLGHTDPRFDGQPAVGWVDNLRLADGGHTLLGDMTGMPGWLAAANQAGNRVISSAYPDRSVEGLYGYRCAIGHTHPFVLTAVALLGVTEPGVGTLKSLQDVQSLYAGVAAAPAGQDGAVAVCAAIPAKTPAVGGDAKLRKYWLHGEGAAKIRWGTDGDFTRCVRELGKHVRDPKGLCAEYHHEATGMWPGDARNTHKVKADAGIDPEVKEGAVPSPKPSLADRVRAAWNAVAPVSQWICEIDGDHVVVVDDTDRTRLRVPVAVDDEHVTFGAPLPVAASRVVFASREESRPDVAAASPEPPAEPDGTEPEPEEEDAMSSTLTSDLRSRLGLTEDADDAAVLAALDQRLKSGQPDTSPPTEPVPDPAPPVPAEPAGPPAPVEPAKELVNAAGDGLLRQHLEAMSKELAQIKAARAADEKTAYFDAAVKAGKITPAARGTWEARYDSAPAVIRDILDATADGAAVPVHASGYTGSPDQDGVDSEYTALEASLYPEHMRLAGRNTR